MQPVGRRGGSGETAVAAVQNFLAPFRRALVPADFQQHSDDVAHHVVQKRVGGDFYDNLLAFATDIDEIHLPKRATRLTILRTERAEIVLTAQTRGSGTHRFDRQGLETPGDPPAHQRRIDFAVEDDVAITPCDGAIARVKTRWRFIRPQNADVTR